MGQAIADIVRQSCIRRLSAGCVPGFRAARDRGARPRPDAARSIAVPKSLDLVRLLGFGNRRKAQNLPRLLPEDVADEVVFMQPLHDDDDGAVALVVEPAVEGMVVPIVGGL